MEDSNFVKKLHVVGENKPYSTDIAAMWEVEEMIYQKGLAEKYITNLILITGSTGFHLVHASPADRCKAALLAVMDGEDKRGR
jgi:hypothetical protein